MYMISKTRANIASLLSPYAGARVAQVWVARLSQQNTILTLAMTKISLSRQGEAPLHATCTRNTEGDLMIVVVWLLSLLPYNSTLMWPDPCVKTVSLSSHSPLLCFCSPSLSVYCCEIVGMQPVQRFAPRCSHQISGYLGTHARSSGIWYGLPLRPETRWMSVIRLTRH